MMPQNIQILFIIWEITEEYSEGASKPEKGVLRRLSKQFTFDVQSGSLFYVDRGQPTSTFKRMVLQEQEKAKRFRRVLLFTFCGPRRAGQHHAKNKGALLLALLLQGYCLCCVTFYAITAYHNSCILTWAFQRQFRTILDFFNVGIYSDKLSGAFLRLKWGADQRAALFWNTMVKNGYYLFHGKEIQRNSEEYF